MVTFANSLDALNTATLGVFGNCTAKWPGGSCNALLDSAFVDTLGVVNSEYTLLIASADIASLSVTASVTVDGVAYSQRERRPDGGGMVRIVLEPA